MASRKKMAVLCLGMMLSAGFFRPQMVYAAKETGSQQTAQKSDAMENLL